MKYNIEGNFSFYDELYKSLDEPSSNITNDSDMCLITKEPLTDNYVTLECKHKFNYDSLYKEIYHQKCRLRLYNIIHLPANMRDIYKKSGKDYFIICPYCRNMQFELLPDLNKDIYPKVYGINSYDKSYIRVEDENTRGYTKNGFFYNMSKVNSCIHKGCVSTVCAYNDRYKFFSCSAHMSYEINKKRIEIKKQADEKKMKIKEEKNKLKEEKEKIKQEKNKLKEEKVKNKKHVNTVIVTNNEINTYNPNENNAVTSICSAILKSGINKGQLCGANIVCEGLCKRHFKIKQPTVSAVNSLELVDLDNILINSNK